MGDDLEYEVVCYEGIHTTYIYLSLIFGAIYIIGLPAILMYLLYVRRRQIQQQPENPVLRAQYGSLYQQYESDYYWFELVQMTKKVTKPCFP